MDDSVQRTGFTMAGRRRRGVGALVVGVALVAIAALGLALVRGRVPVEPASGSAERAAVDTGTVAMTTLAQQNIGLVVVPAETRAIVRAVRATGIVGADETRVVRLRPLSRGRLLRSEVELGSRVTAGQVVATYDNIEMGDLTGQLTAAQAGLAQARAEADAAHKALERTRELVAIGGVARAEVERRAADEARATAAIRTQEAEIAKLGEKLRRFGVERPASGGRSAPTPILAPIDGVVIRIDVVPGEIVDVDRELYTIADLSTVWVQADVLERDLALVRPGLEASVGVAGYPEQRFAGVVGYVADMLDPKTNMARVRCAVANPDGALKLNMFASIEIGVPAGRAGVTAPPDALQYIDGQPVVFVRKDAERFERRDVRLGVGQRAWVELAEGVAAGEGLVTAGSFALKSILLHDRIAGD